MKVRYLIKYTKESEIKFISHLDLMRTIQRTIRRAGLPVEFSKGFNPHMTLSIAQPLSVGVYSKGEYMDVVFVEEVNENEIINKLNENAPRGIKFLDAKKVEKDGDKKAPQAMAIIDGAEYKIKLKANNSEKALEEIKSLDNIEQWNIIKKSKKGEKEVNIKPLVKSIKYSIEGEFINIEAIFACGSRENLSANLFIEYLVENTCDLDKNSFADIERIDMFALKDEKLLPLNKYF